MKIQSKESVEKKFMACQEILKEAGRVWKQVDLVEEMAIKLFGEDHPISENLGFAAVHMMNTYMEIEDNINDSPNMLEVATLAQIIDVLSRILWSGAAYRGALIEAYQVAVKRVADFHSIHRNTVADACTKRLQLNRDGFFDLVENWLGGRSGDLKRCLKAHCDVIKHGLINDFFSGERKGGQIH